jgi:Anti-sigma-K factor rskA
MNDERDLTEIEQLLRSTPAPAEVPAGFEALARAAALESAPGAVVRGPAVDRRPRFAWGRGRLGPAVAVLAAAAAASLYFGVGGRGNGFPAQTTVALAAVKGSPMPAASGTLQVGAANGAMRPVVFKVSGLQPAPAGHYYEMWFATGNESVEIMAFNTASDGSVTVHSEIPVGMSWKRCWVSMESGSPAIDQQQPTVMASPA